MRPIETRTARNCEIFAGPDLRFGKEGDLWSERLSLAQQGDPFDEDVSEALPDWEEPGRERLRALRSYARARPVRTSSFSMSICFSLKEMIARSRAPERSANAIKCAIALVEFLSTPGTASIINRTRFTDRAGF